MKIWLIKTLLQALGLRCVQCDKSLSLFVSRSALDVPPYGPKPAVSLRCVCCGRITLSVTDGSHNPPGRPQASTTPSPAPLEREPAGSPPPAHLDQGQIVERRLSVKAERIRLEYPLTPQDAARATAIAICWKQREAHRRLTAGGDSGIFC